MVFYIYTYFWVIQWSESCICKIFVNSLKLAHNLTFFTLNWLDWKWHLEQSEALLIFFLFIYWFGWWQWYGYMYYYICILQIAISLSLSGYTCQSRQGCWTLQIPITHISTMAEGRIIVSRLIDIFMAKHSL